MGLNFNRPDAPTQTAPAAQAELEQVKSYDIVVDRKQMSAELVGSLIACIVQAADTISAARPGARRETLETYTNRLKQLEDITNSFKGVDKSFAIQAGREIRIMVVPEQVSDADMVLLARDVAKQIEAELEYPGQIKVSVIRESRAVDYAK